jgi:hypothetical protein
MRRLEEKARTDGLDTVILSASLVAKRFYNSLGYRTLSAKSAIMEDGEKLDYFEMAKQLRPNPSPPRKRSKRTSEQR